MKNTKYFLIIILKNKLANLLHDKKAFKELSSL